MKVLIIEDEKDLSDSIHAYLRGEGHICEVAVTFQAAADKVNDYEYDCVLLDLTLPGGNGLQLIEDIKANHPSTGIVVISARDSIDDKLRGFDLGADDYLPKPFHLSELTARMRAVMRRSQFGGQRTLSFGEILLHLDDKTCLVAGQALPLTPKEFDLLLYFMSHQGRVLTKAAIAEHLWGDNMDAADSYDFIYSHIKNLRKKIVDKGGGDYLQTVYGMGYRFGNS